MPRPLLRFALPYGVRCAFALSVLALPLAPLVGCASPDAPPAPDAPADSTADVPAGAPAALTLSGAYAPVAPAGGTSAVFVHVAAGPEADTLTGARSDVAERVEVHETYDGGDGLRGMREVEGGIPVPAGGTVDLRPGGYHVMLIGLTGPLAAGDTVDVAFTFARSGEQTASVAVRALDDLPAPAPEASPRP